MNRISMNGNSALLSDLAREAGSFIRSAPVSTSLNVIPVTMINAPASVAERSGTSSGANQTQYSSGANQTQSSRTNQTQYSGANQTQYSGANQTQSSSRTNQTELSGANQTQYSSRTNQTQEREEIKVNTTRVESDEDFLNLEKTEEGIVISAELCNDRDIAQWNMSPFTELRLLQISYHCFCYFTAWRVADLPALEVLEIGDKCFTQCSEPPSYPQNYAFEVVNCPRLRSIRVGNNCFVEWGKCVMESAAWGKEVRNRAACAEGSLYRR